MTPHQLARATLNTILTERTTTNAQLVAAARALQREHPEPAKHNEQREDVLVLWIDNDRGPLPKGKVVYVCATAHKNVSEPRSN